MRSYILRRATWIAPMLIGISILVFVLRALSPFDAADTMTYTQLQDRNHPRYDAVYHQNKKRLHLDLPTFYFSIKPDSKNSSIWPPKISWNGIDNQYHRWLTDLTRGKWGISVIDGRDVLHKVSTALPWTLFLSLLSVLLTVLLSLAVGSFQVLSKGRFWDSVIGSVMLIIYSMPLFWVATMMVIFFTTSRYGPLLDWFPSPGVWRMTENDSFLTILWNNAHAIILPILVLTLHDTAYLSSMVRNGIIDEEKRPYRTALRAKGLSSTRILWRHLLPNSLASILMVVVSSIPNILSGSLIIEVIFNIPGMGRLLHESILAGDWSIVTMIVMISSIVVMGSYIVNDIAMYYLFPKLREKTSVY